jgi:hypothetical protein
MGQLSPAELERLIKANSVRRRIRKYAELLPEAKHMAEGSGV